MSSSGIYYMRGSLWLLLATATLVSVYYWLFNTMSGFAIWRESNALGVILQIGLFFVYPAVLFLALKKSSKSNIGTGATFALGWTAVAALMLFLEVI